MDSMTDAITDTARIAGHSTTSAPGARWISLALCHWRSTTFAWTGLWGVRHVLDVPANMCVPAKAEALDIGTHGARVSNGTL